MPQNSKFRLPCGHRFSAKIRLQGYGAKSRWGPPRVYLGANGVPLGPKNGSNPLKITMPPNSNFRLHSGHRFRPKFDFKVMVPNHGGDPLMFILGPMGSHWVQKMGRNRKNYHAPKDEFSNTFWPKFDLTVMAPNHGGDPLRSILGPMGSHWVQKMGQNRKKLPCPRIQNFD